MAGLNKHGFYLTLNLIEIIISLVQHKKMITKYRIVKGVMMVMVLNIIIIVLNSCSLLRKDKYGCPNDARGMTEEQINAKANKKKYKGGTKL